MEVLRFTPAQSPLHSATFSGNEFAEASSAAVRSCCRPKPLALARLSKPAPVPSAISPSVEELHSPAPLSPLSPPASEKPLLVVPPSSLQCESGYLVSNKYPGNGAIGGGTLNEMEYLTNILSSKVYDVAYESPLQLAPKLSERWGVNVWLKREDFQPVCIQFDLYIVSLHR